MKPSLAELRVLAAVKPTFDRFHFMFDGIAEKIRTDHTDGLEDECWETIPLFRAYQRALRRVHRVQDRNKPVEKKAERRDDRKFGFALLGLVIFGGALGKSPQEIRRTLGAAADVLLAPRMEAKNSLSQWL
jgi:hypothetical protein